MSLSDAPEGWVARFTAGEIPLVAWAVVDVECPTGKHPPHRILEGLVLREGWHFPRPIGTLVGEGKGRMGEFIGYYRES